eukprot:COSAG01_NODE_12821_length_1680_cov_37.033165_1_plen_298_part_00
MKGDDDFTSMNIGQLRLRASNAGISAGDIEEARDSETPKEALISLIKETEQKQAAAPAPSLAATEILPATAPAKKQQAWQEEKVGVGGQGFSLSEKLAGTALVVSFLLLIFQIVTLAELLSMKEAADDIIQELDELTQHDIMSDFMGTIFDQGRIRATLTSGATLAGKIENTDWTQAKHDDTELKYCDAFFCDIDKKAATDLSADVGRVKKILTDIASGMPSSKKPNLDNALLDANTMVQNLFNSDWKGMANACVVAAREAKKADWYALLDSQQDAKSIKSALHAIGKLCDKVAKNF